MVTYDSLRILQIVFQGYGGLETGRIAVFHDFPFITPWLAWSTEASARSAFSHWNEVQR